MLIPNADITEIPDTAKEKPLQGKVVAVGNGTKDEDMVKFCLITQSRKQQNLALVQCALKVTLISMAKAGLPLQENSDFVIMDCPKVQMHHSSYAKS